MPHHFSRPQHYSLSLSSLSVHLYLFFYICTFAKLLVCYPVQSLSQPLSENRQSSKPSAFTKWSLLVILCSYNINIIDDGSEQIDAVTNNAEVPLWMMRMKVREKEKRQLHIWPRASSGYIATVWVDRGTQLLGTFFPGIVTEKRGRKLFTIGHTYKSQMPHTRTYTERKISKCTI